MKATLVLIFFIGCASVGTQNDDLTFSNRIAIETNDNAATALENMQHIFQREGYDIEQKFDSSSHLSLTTKITVRLYGDSSAETLALKFAATVERSDSGAVIILQGEYMPSAGGYLQAVDSAGIDRDRKLFLASGEEIHMAGSAGTALRESWDLMSALASNYAGGSVFYQRTTNWERRNALSY